MPISLETLINANYKAIVRPTELEALGGGLRNLCSIKSSKWFNIRWTLKTIILHNCSENEGWGRIYREYLWDCEMTEAPSSGKWSHLKWVWWDWGPVSAHSSIEKTQSCSASSLLSKPKGRRKESLLLSTLILHQMCPTLLALQVWKMKHRWHP